MKFFSSSKTTITNTMSNMPDLKRLSLADLQLLMDMKEAEEQKRAEEEARRKAAEEATRKAEEEVAAKAAKAKVRKVAVVKKRKAVEVESGSEVEPRPSQKKGKGKARVTSTGSAEEAEDVCLRWGPLCSFIGVSLLTS
jgi:flagellar biosynthesis component FlhA